MPSPLTGQATCTGTSTGVPLSSTPVTCVAYTIKAPKTNSAAVFLGPSTVTNGNGYQLDAGDELTYVRNTQNAAVLLQLSPSDYWVAGTNGDKVTWLASP